MERNTIDNANEKKRPVRAAFGYFDVAAVVNGEEDMSCTREIWESVFEGQGIGGLDEHKGHGGAKEDYLCIFIAAEMFTFEVSSSRFLSIDSNHYTWAAYSSQNAIL